MLWAPFSYLWETATTQILWLFVAMVIWHPRNQYSDGLFWFCFFTSPVSPETLAHHQLSVQIFPLVRIITGLFVIASIAAAASIGANKMRIFSPLAAFWTLRGVYIKWCFISYSAVKAAKVTELMSSHRGCLLSEPLWISLILAVHIHLLGPQGHAAVTVEVETVVSTDVRPLLLQLSVLRLQELRQTRFSPLGPSEERRKQNPEYAPCPPGF